MAKAWLVLERSYSYNDEHLARDFGHSEEPSAPLEDVRGLFHSLEKAQAHLAVLERQMFREMYFSSYGNSVLDYVAVPPEEFFERMGQILEKPELVAHAQLGAQIPGNDDYAYFAWLHAAGVNQLPSDLTDEQVDEVRTLFKIRFYEVVEALPEEVREMTNSVHDALYLEGNWEMYDETDVSSE